MIAEILPQPVVAVETTEDLLDIVLFPGEEHALGKAVDKRRREFTSTRACARIAFAKLDLPPAPIVPGVRGEPQWPEGVVGSITHCDGYRACAIGRAKEILTIGIDAEPNARLPDRVLGEIARPEELPRLGQLQRARPQVHWDRLLFSAKETVYKAWFPLTKSWLGFEEAVVAFDPSENMFSARVLVPGPMINGHQLTGFSGRWLARDGLLLTAIALLLEEWRGSLSL